MSPSATRLALLPLCRRWRARDYHEVTWNLGMSARFSTCPVQAYERRIDQARVSAIEKGAG